MTPNENVIDAVYKVMKTHGLHTAAENDTILFDIAGSAITEVLGALSIMNLIEVLTWMEEMKDVG